MADAQNLHLIYIHGFRGDHTSFQSFPTDLHQHLTRLLPTRIKLNSCLYPTYKSRGSIEDASHKFLSWLEKQLPGPVILLAHSMGGLLAADAVSSTASVSKRIIGLDAFDVPFLGMHPHVIISGISSLLPKDQHKSEKHMNDGHLVKIVEDEHSDKDAHPDSGSLYSAEETTTSTSSVSLSGSQLDLAWEQEKSSFTKAKHTSTSSLSFESASESRSPSSSTSKSTFHSITTHLSSLTSHASRELAEKGAFSLSHTIQTTKSLISPHIPPALARGLALHSDDPFRSAIKWVTEHFEFGVCMFDPSGLRSRYSQLEHWGGGRWVNLWTEVPARIKVGSGSPPANTSPKHGAVSDAYFDSSMSIPNNTADMPEILEAYTETGRGKDNAAQIEAKETRRKQLSEKLRHEREHERAHPASSRPARHFIVLPHASGTVSGSAAAGFHLGSREKWQKVSIEGAEDEVGAHTGIFMRDVNVGYGGLVERVGTLIISWC